MGTPFHPRIERAVHALDTKRRTATQKSEGGNLSVCVHCRNFKSLASIRSYHRMLYVHSKRVHLVLKLVTGNFYSVCGHSNIFISPSFIALRCSVPNLQEIGYSFWNALVFKKWQMFDAPSSPSGGDRDIRH